MFNLLFADHFRIWNNDLWYALPIVIALSLVYAATRHEQMRPILVHAGRMAVWIVGFMFAVFVVVEVICWFI
jgi:cytochrome c oxidase assembly factor CtaG